ncbi:putative WRKY transcription factor 52 [Morella rubra]|uniref:Putative WRKY transcription factor 52 n=1 Tax=Morella rubra TaxID=262757 RepID=A0A6A1UKC5_9ROSI|nr:putative WRKY transcription factor 52 [Morella rubra]
MELCGYPLENLPTNLQLDNLIKLSMRYSSIRKLWEGTKSLSNLKGIDLRWSEHLIEIPDLSGAPNLERLNLEGCKRLEKFPDLSNMECLEDFQAVGTAIAQLPSPSLFPKNIKRIIVRGYQDSPPDSGDLGFSDVSLSKRSSEPINVSYFNFWSPAYILDACCINYCDNKRSGRMLYLELERFIDEHEGFEGKSRGHERILGSVVAHGMPDWFNNRSSGPSVILEMPQNLDDEGRLGDFLLLQTPDIASVGPIGFWAFIPVEWFLEQSNNWEGWSYIKASIAADSMDPSTNSSIVEVKECGARLLYEGDALEFSNAVAHGWHLDYYRLLSGHDFENSGAGDGVSPLTLLGPIEGTE